MNEPIFQEQVLEYLAWLSMGMLSFYIVFLVVHVVAWWRIFEKADQPGWASIVPVFNFIVFNRIAQYPWWFIFLYLVPLVNVVVYIVTLHKLMKLFGKDGWFTTGMVVLSLIFTPILAFGSSEYRSQELK